METLINILSKYDEVDILEMLEITTEELLEAFRDKIEERYDDLMEKLG